MTEKGKIQAKNLSAQLRYRAAGNPLSAHPSTAISNCFPGLEFDFRNLWRRSLVGIVLLESNNYVVEVEDPRYAGLLGHRLLRIDGHPIVALMTGPIGPGFADTTLSTSNNPNAVAFMEWSNSIARVLAHAGQSVRCEFTAEPSPTEQAMPTQPTQLLVADLVVRPFFAPGTATFAPDLLQPGELTQSLCSPWQNDYRECACYYWAASRPDYVNVEATPEGASRGDNWMQKERTGEYVLDDRQDSRFIDYDDLFAAWEKHLRFVIQGRDDHDGE